MLKFRDIHDTVMTAVDRWRTLREFRSVEPAVSHFPQSYIDDEVERARMALSVGDRHLALTIWEETRRRFPEKSALSHPTVQLLLDLGSFGELEAMMEWGMSYYPGYPHFAAGYAAVAHRRGDLAVAIRRCESLRRLFPDTAEGYTIASACLADLGHNSEAESLISKAAVRMPHEAEIAFEYARCATRRGDWLEGLKRYNSIRSRFPHISASTCASECLRRLKRYEEAEEITNDLFNRFPGNSWVVVELAQIATAKADWEQSVKFWETARRRNPFHADSYIEGAASARQLGNEGAADAILAEGVERMSSDLTLHLAYAKNAQRLGNSSVAIERWSLAHQRFPESAEAALQLALAVAATQSLAAPATL